MKLRYLKICSNNFRCLQFLFVVRKEGIRVFYIEISCKNFTLSHPFYIDTRKYRDVKSVENIIYFQNNSRKKYKKKKEEKVKEKSGSIRGSKLTIFFPRLLSNSNDLTHSRISISVTRMSLKNIIRTPASTDTRPFSTS